MKAPAHIVFEGRAYRCRDLLALRRRQVAATRSAQGKQRVFFLITIHRRPPPERTAAGALY